MARISVDQMIMQIAKAAALRSTCTKRAAVGAVLSDSTGRIISTGYNGVPSGMPHCDDLGCLLDEDGHCVAAVHAELNAIIQCARVGVSTIGLILHVTHSPCPKCAAALIQAGICKVVFLEEYRDFDTTLSLFAKSGISITSFMEKR